MKISYKDYSEGDEISIINLFFESFNRVLSFDYWKWRYNDNIKKKFMIKLAVDDEKNVLAAHYALSPTDIFIKGKRYNSAISMTTMTHPNYRGLRLFTNLAEKVFTENSESLDVIYGVANDNSLKGFIKYLDFKLINDIQPLTLKVDQKEYQDTLSCEEIESFDSAFSNLIEKSYNKYNVILSRDWTYLNWRYVENPENKYRIFSFKENNEIQGYIVTKVFKNNKNGIVDIVDYLVLNENILEELINHVVNINIKNGIGEFNIWTNDKEYNKILNRIGFEKTNEIFHFIVRHNSTSVPDTIYNFEDWYITMGDIDIF